MEKDYGAHLLASVERFIATLPVKNQAKIFAAIKQMMTGDFKTVHTKQLRGSVHELIVKNYRFIYFLSEGEIYFLSGFVKKSAKTPKREIENAERIFKSF